MITSSGHFHKILDRAQADEVIRQSQDRLKNIQFDTFVFSGMSGAALAPVLGHLMNKQLFMVRRNGGSDQSNAGRSGYWYEGTTAPGHCVVIDDLISSGKTMSNIMHALRDRANGGTRGGIIFPQPVTEVKIVGLLLHCGCTGPVLYKSGDLDFESMISSEYSFKHPITHTLHEHGSLPRLADPEPWRLAIRSTSLVPTL